MSLKTLRPDSDGGYVIEHGTDPVTLQKPVVQPVRYVLDAPPVSDQPSWIKRLWLAAGLLLLTLGGCGVGPAAAPKDSIGSVGGYDVYAVTDTTRGVVCYVLEYKGISCVADVIPAEDSE